MPLISVKLELILKLINHEPHELVLSVVHVGSCLFVVKIAN